MGIERPHPRAVAVELEVPPLLARLGAVEGESGGQVIADRDCLAVPRSLDERVDSIAATGNDPGAPVEERLGALDGPSAAHRVGDERTIAQPRVAIHPERRRGRVGPADVLVCRDDLDTPLGEGAQLSQ